MTLKTMRIWKALLLVCSIPPVTSATTRNTDIQVSESSDLQTVFGSQLNSEPILNNPGAAVHKEFWRAQREIPVAYRASASGQARSRDLTARGEVGVDNRAASLYRSRPLGILEEDIEAVVAAEMDAPPTATIPLYECPSSYRATPDGDGSTFQVFDSGRWWTQNCQEGLVWDQTLCRCEYPPGTRWELDCRDFRSVPEGNTPGSFQQLVNGAWVTRDCSPSVAGLVWDQDSCRCVWGPQGPEGAAVASPCDIMLNMTFDQGVKDEAKGSFVEVGQGLPLPTRNDPERGPSRSGNRAAYFTDTALNIWYFSDNEMGSSLRLEFRFYLDNVAHNNGGRRGSGGARLGQAVESSVYQMFLSNGCNLSAPGYTAPSVAVGFRPSDQSFLLAFETSGVRKAIVCSRPSSPGRWHSISLLYEDGTLVMRVDGRPCIISADFSGPIQKTSCPLTIGADPLDRQGVYRGYMDDLLIARNCREAAQKNTGSEQVSDSMTVSQQPVAFKARADSVETLHLQQRRNRFQKGLGNPKRDIKPTRSRSTAKQNDLNGDKNATAMFSEASSNYHSSCDDCSAVYRLFHEEIDIDTTQNSARHMRRESPSNKEDVDKKMSKIPSRDDFLSSSESLANEITSVGVMRKSSSIANEFKDGDMHDNIAIGTTREPSGMANQTRLIENNTTRINDKYMSVMPTFLQKSSVFRAAINGVANHHKPRVDGRARKTRMQARIVKPFQERNRSVVPKARKFKSPHTVSGLSTRRLSLNRRTWYDHDEETRHLSPFSAKYVNRRWNYKSQPISQLYLPVNPDRLLKVDGQWKKSRQRYAVRDPTRPVVKKPPVVTIKKWYE